MACLVGSPSAVNPAVRFVATYGKLLLTTQVRQGRGGPIIFICCGSLTIRAAPTRKDGAAVLERTEYPPGVPCRIDTAQPDPEAATRFYGGLFG